MKKFFRFIQLYYRGIFRGLYFVMAIAVIMVFLPREGKFKYEFQKGKPWMHEDLSAPFDFPIYKTDAELFEEKNAILRNFNPFFKLDTTSQYPVLAQFRADFKTEWAAFQPRLRSIQQLYKKENLNANEVRRRYISYAEALISFVYEKGIYDPADYNPVSGDPNQEISILVDNLKYDTEIGEIFSQRKALEYVLERLNKKAVSDAPEMMAFWQMFDFQKYIQPNLLFDERTTERIKSDLVSNISLTKGMVQAGDRIISNYEVVNSESFRILESLRKEYESKLGATDTQLVFLGQALLVGILFLVLYLFLLNFRPEVILDDRKTLFILLLITFMVVVSSLVLRNNLVSIYVIPFAIIPIFVRAFYDSRLALFILLVTIFLVGFFVPNSFEFVFLNFIAGIVAIISLTNLYRRGKLFLSVSLVLLSYWVVYIGIVTIQEGTPLALNWLTLVWFVGNALLLLASYQLVFVFEKMFGFLSDATLMELSDTNQDLLRKLAEVAPGTFQHSLQVANLAEAAVYKIGGNPLLVRAGALYHDIGKMTNPFYFIENQSPDFNPHQNLDFEESASIIIKHVTEGVQLGRKYRLPQQLIDFIRTHHGTTKVKYFYRLYKDKFPEVAIDAEKFTYPGPRPFSRETAVLMMADSVEAASRSLKKVSYQSIDDLVEGIINHQQIEEQFNDADITFKDITTIKTVFKKKLLNIYHARIEYPEEKK
ncbi:MAG: HDIG domain-containing protein [Bacteroidales bacterium]|nr:HDIG domain-containing protein [Bacteroidales bacterium]MBN2749542.1 HDIG domain-containing protein [Bacteroidales bacterium]